MGLFTSSGTQVGIERSGNDYWLWQDIGSSRKWYVKLLARVSPSVIHALESSQIRNSSGDVIANLNDSGSVWEYAINLNGGFVGNAHGKDTQTSLAITVDGVVTVLSDGQSATGSSGVIVTRMSDLNDFVDADAATVTVTYTMLPATGLTVVTDFDWSQVVTEIDAAMTPYGDLLDVGYLVDTSGRYYNMLAYVDTTINYAAVVVEAGLAFDRDGNAAILMIANDGARTMLQQDRGALNKLYSYVDGALVDGYSTNYRAMWFDSTATLLR